MKIQQVWIAVLCLCFAKQAEASNPCSPCGGNCGESLGSLRDVDAFSNGARGNCTGTGRGFYQCVEYAKRFNGRSNERWGNANQIFDRAERLGLSAFRNGGEEPPRQGDAVTFLGGRYGHIAIIYSVESNAITLIEQNWHNVSRYFRRLEMRVEGGRYTVMSDSRNYTVQGWLRSNTDPTTQDTDGDGVTPREGDCNDSDRNVHPGATERCNRRDDDCDRATDENWSNLGRSCSVRVGVCERTGVWICEPLERGTVCDADYTTYPELCNSLDDDCDGETDEGFWLGGVCSAGLGECARSGTYVCRADGRDTRCSATPGAPGTEVCSDARDNDCDGQTDEEGTFSCPGPEMAPIACFCIDRYEASRPIATATSTGWQTGNNWIPQSIAGVLPWDIVNWYEARTACGRAGKRLCTSIEWRRACEGPRGLSYPYGNTYDPLICNGWDAPGDDVVPTGSMPGCVSEEGVYDLSGNTWEWIINLWDMRDGGALGASHVYQDNIFLLSCWVAPGPFTPDIQSGNIGFRCCWP